MEHFAKPHRLLAIRQVFEEMAVQFRGILVGEHSTLQKLWPPGYWQASHWEFNFPTEMSEAFACG
jgi:hypothetical protein